jgi:hypothetical protein
MKRREQSTNARGYGHVHQKMRLRYAELDAAGLAVCARCGLAIDPMEPWDLDHRDDRHGWLGPSHRRCNRATSKPRPRTREW